MALVAPVPLQPMWPWWPLMALMDLAALVVLIYMVILVGEGVLGLVFRVMAVIWTLARGIC